MPLEGFYCPDEEKVKLEDCFEQCRLGERCLTLPTLVTLSREREWSGVASTTQLLNGTMMEYLKLTQPYYVNPQTRAFMLAGSKHHKALEEIAKELNLPAEIPLSIDRDIFDLLEFEGKELVLTDYKLWGSFRVAKALGIEQIGKQPDPSGVVYKSSGKWGKAGSPKMVPVFKENPDKAERWEAELQLNRYRVMLEELGLTIHKMRIQATVRDGGIAIAYGRGVFKNIYKIPVKFLDDMDVLGYFTVKDANLKLALASGWTIPCSKEECWEDMRCKRYCDVWNYCPKGKLIHSIEGGE